MKKILGAFFIVSAFALNAFAGAYVGAGNKMPNGEACTFYRDKVWAFCPSADEGKKNSKATSAVPIFEADNFTPNTKIKAWASSVISYIAGTGNINKILFGKPEKTLGAITTAESNAHVVCLGNGGSITYGFETPIADGKGFDFAVFENSFSDNYLELAYVEVSSDGVNFIRFPNFYLDTSIVYETNAFVDPRMVYNLASKYDWGNGHGFDLAELKYAYEYALYFREHPNEISDFSEEYIDEIINIFENELIDLQNINYVRVVDIYGDGTCNDSAGNPIYDPIPDSQNTQSGSPGADIRGVGVLHYAGEPEEPDETRPTIALQPEDIVCETGDTIEFFVSASDPLGLKIKYKWEFKKAGSEKWVSTGSSKNVLKIKKPSVSLNGAQYRCLVYNAKCSKDPVESESAFLYVKGEAKILTQPKAATSYGDNVVTYSVAAAGYNVKFLWEISYDKGKTWTAFEEDGNALSFIPECLGKYQIRCKAWSVDDAGSIIGKVAKSKSVSGTVREPVLASPEMSLNISKYPETISLNEADENGRYNAFIFEGYTAALKVYSGGYKPKYQWQISDDGLNWESIKRATKSTYAIPKPAKGSAGREVFYKCLVSNGSDIYGSNSESKIVKVKICEPFAPKTVSEMQMDFDDLQICGIEAKTCTVYRKFFDEEIKDVKYSYSRISPMHANLSLEFQVDYENTNGKIIKEKYKYSGKIIFKDFYNALWKVKITKDKKVLMNTDIAGEIYSNSP